MSSNAVVTSLENLLRDVKSAGLPVTAETCEEAIDEIKQL